MGRDQQKEVVGIDAFPAMRFRHCFEGIPASARAILSNAESTQDPAIIRGQFNSPLGIIEDGCSTDLPPKKLDKRE